MTKGGIVGAAAAQPVAPALMMEDLATARMSAAQIGQRLRHSARCADTGETHTLGMVREMLSGECRAACEHELHLEPTPGMALLRGRREERYRMAERVALRWVLRCARGDFTSLGAWTRAELCADAAAPTVQSMMMMASL